MQDVLILILILICLFKHWLWDFWPYFEGDIKPVATGFQIIQCIHMGSFIFSELLSLIMLSSTPPMHHLLSSSSLKSLLYWNSRQTLLFIALINKVLISSIRSCPSSAALYWYKMGTLLVSFDTFCGRGNHWRHQSACVIIKAQQQIILSYNEVMYDVNTETLSVLVRRLCQLMVCHLHCVK